jgi:signal transduction histidine kinase
MVMAFGILDWLVQAEPLWGLITLRVAITLALLFTCWASYQRWFDRCYLPVMCGIYAVTSLGILSIPLIASGNRLVAEHYYVGAMLCLSAMMTLTLFSARVVLALTAFIAAAHLMLAPLVLDLPRNKGVLASQLFFLWSSACIGFVGIWFRNRMLEEKLELTRRLEEQVAITERASREKSRFMAAASHDLRQPLQAIALFGAVVGKELHGAGKQALAQRLMHVVGTLQTSLETMLDISRLDAGVVGASLRPVPLNEILRSLSSVFFSQAEAKGLQFRLRATSLWAYSDARLLSSMLSNLVDNAIKYTQEGGVLVVCRVRGDEVVIEVRDTGIGIEPDQQELIFEEFYQVNNLGRDRAKGLGLGLSIVKRLSLLLGHPIHVTSAFGRGTRFQIKLKAAPKASLPLSVIAEELHGQPAHRLPARVLVLDDEQEIRAALSALLASFGIDVVTVPDIDTAEAEVLKAMDALQPFDTLICDYRLANGADGLDFAESILRRPELGLAVILLTGETAPDRLHRASATGVRVLFKPVSAQDLLRALTGQ